MQQIVGIASKMIGAIGNTFSARKKRIDQGYRTESGHCCGDTHLDIYGCEAWTIHAKHMGKIQATQMRVLSRIEGVSRLVRMRKVSFRGILKQEGVSDIYMVKRQQ